MSVHVDYFSFVHIEFDFTLKSLCSTEIFFSFFAQHGIVCIIKVYLHLSYRVGQIEKGWVHLILVFETIAQKEKEEMVNKMGGMSLNKSNALSNAESNVGRTVEDALFATRNGAKHKPSGT